VKKLFIILFFFQITFGFSQKAEMTLDNKVIRIGEQTKLRIFFEYQNPDEDALIGWPQFDQYLTKKKEIEIIEKTVDYESLKDSLTQTYLREQQLTITGFKPGNYIIPAQKIELNDAVYETNEIEILVNTVEVDTSKGIVDIKPKYEVEYTIGERATDWFKDYWPWLATSAVLLALFLLFRIWKNRKVEEPEKEIPKIPAHLTAMTGLNELLRNERWKEENKKEYYSKLTDTVRLYLEERFNIFAMEQTTREIIVDLKTSDISEEDKIYLSKILGQADMVKFAKFSPNDEDGQISLNQSIEFVERTKKVEDQNQPKKTSE